MFSCSQQILALASQLMVFSASADEIFYIAIVCFPQRLLPSQQVFLTFFVLSRKNIVKGVSSSPVNIDPGRLKRVHHFDMLLLKP